MGAAPSSNPIPAAAIHNLFFMIDSFSWLKLLTGSSFLVFHPRRAQHVVHRHIAFVASILEQLVSRLLSDRKCSCPRGSVGLGIVRGELIIDFIRTHAGELFGKFHLVAIGSATVAIYAGRQRTAQQI